MNKNYLKVKWFDCLKCKGKNTWEVVVAGIMTHRRKEQPHTERIIGYHCHQCEIRQKAELKNIQNPLNFEKL